MQRPTHQGKPCTWHGRHDFFRVPDADRFDKETFVLYKAGSPIRFVSNVSFLWLKSHWLIAGCFLKLWLAKSSLSSFLGKKRLFCLVPPCIGHSVNSVWSFKTLNLRRGAREVGL